MNRQLIAALLVTTLAALGIGAIAASGNKGKSYIGLTYPPYPMECKDRGGFVVWPYDRSPEYVVSFLECDGTHIVWLGKVLFRNANGAPVREVRAEIQVPNNGRTTIAGSLCHFLEGTGAQVVTIHESLGKFPKIPLAVWRVDADREKFVSVNPETIRCESGP